MASLADLLAMARHRFEICQVKPEEKVVILADTGSDKALVDVFYAVAATWVGDPVLTICHQPPPTQGQDYPDYLVDAMLEADVVFDLSSVSAYYSESHAKLTLGKHVRYGLVGGRRLSVITNLRYPPDPVIEERCKRAQRMIDGAKTLRVTSSLGTDLSVERGDVDQFRSIRQGGGVVSPGEVRDLFGGWVALAVPESGVNGVVYFVGAYDVIRRGITHQMVDEPVIMEIEEGRLVKIGGHEPQAAFLDKWFSSWNDPNSYRFSHINLGLDHRARLHQDPDVYLHCIYGSVLFAFGCNYSPHVFGPGAQVRAKSHVDFTLIGPDLYLDDELILREGEFTIGSGLRAT